MSNCSNCYNGCTEIVSDRCVKYTGINVPVLGIQTGDSLSFVEQSLITFLTSALNGTGINPIIDPQIICNLVQANLPTCGDLSLNDILSALIKSTCDLQEQVDVIAADLAILNADYSIGCLSGVTASSDTHAIVQAIINKVCQLQVDLIALALDVTTNYVKVADLNSLIQYYLSVVSGITTNYYNRMVPYVVETYYGSISGFSITGVGSGVWQKIYLCNGLNGTPNLTPTGAYNYIQYRP
jgi:hypothetical protein